MVKVKPRNQEPQDDYEDYVEDVEEVEDADDVDDDVEYDEEGEYEAPAWKRWVIIGAVVAVIAGGAIMVRMMNANNKNQTTATSSSTSSSSTTTEETSSSTTTPSSTETASNEDAAVDSLERSSAVATDEQTTVVRDHLVKAIDKLNADPENFKTDQESGLFLTGNAMVSALKIAHYTNYTLDANSVKVYLANADNVLQFTANFVNGDKYITFVGNYVPTTEQIEIAQMKGELDLQSSTGGNPQVTADAEAQSDTPVNPDAIISGDEGQ